MSKLRVKFEPKGVSPMLPFELLHIVATHADRHSLIQMCLVNSVVGDVATSHLYMDLRLTKSVAVAKCLKAVSMHPELGRHVRVLSIRFDTKARSYLTDAFGILLRGALCNMPRLVSLELDLCEDGFGRYLLGCPARIMNVSLACDWDDELAIWLREQSAIQRFIFYGYSNPAISLHPSALPNLRSIYSTPSVISRVVPGRPVQRVFVTTTVPEIFSGPAIEVMARSCKSSTGPVSALYLVHSTPRRARALPPAEIFTRLSSIPKHLPGLTKFSLQVYSYSFEEPLFEMLRDFVAGFRQLKYLDLFTKERGREGCALNNLKLPDLARSFGERCPSLRAIRFSLGSLHALHSAGKWIGTWDINQLQEEVMTATDSLQGSLAREARGESSADQGDSPSDRPFLTPELKTALLRDMNASLNKLHVAVGYRGTTTARCLDIMSPETDADVVASICLAYDALHRLLETLRRDDGPPTAST